MDLLHPGTFIAGEDPQSLTSSYTFIAKTTDYASRFKLVFSVCGDADGDNGDADGDNGGGGNAPFAFVGNGEIHLLVCMSFAS